MWLPQGPADKGQIENVKKQVQHNPAHWSGEMVKLMIIVGVAIGGLLIWAVLS